MDKIRKLQKIENQHKDWEVLSLVFTQSGKLFSGGAGFHEDGGNICAYIYNKEKKEFKFDKLLKGHNVCVNNLCLLKDNRILSCSDDSTMIKWNVDTYEQLAVFKGHKSSVYCAIELNDGKIASGGKYNEIKIWDSEGQCLQTLEDSINEYPRDLLFTNIYSLIELKDKRLVSFNNKPSSVVRFWDSTKYSLQEEHTIKNLECNSWTNATFYLPEENRILVGSGDEIKIINLEKYEVTKNIMVGEKGERIESIAKLLDGNYIVIVATKNQESRKLLKVNSQLESDKGSEKEISKDDYLWNSLVINANLFVVCGLNGIVFSYEY